MLIKSNDFLPIQLAREEPLDAKLIRRNRVGVQNCTITTCICETEQSFSAPPIQPLWMKMAKVVEFTSPTA